MKKFWKWKNKTVTNGGDEPVLERILFLNGTIAEESWFDDDVTPKIFKDELMGGGGDITVWINSPGGDCVAAAQIYNMVLLRKRARIPAQKGRPFIRPSFEAEEPKIVSNMKKVLNK